MCPAAARKRVNSGSLLASGPRDPRHSGGGGKPCRAQGDDRLACSGCCVPRTSPRVLLSVCPPSLRLHQPHGCRLVSRAADGDCCGAIVSATRPRRQTLRSLRRFSNQSQALDDAAASPSPWSFGDELCIVTRPLIWKSVIEDL